VEGFKLSKIFRRYWQYGIVLCLLFALSVVQVSALMASPETRSGELAPSQITQELAGLEHYVQYIDSNGIRLQTFDSNAAIEDGFSKDVVLLAQEIVAFQNDMAKLGFESGTKDITQLDISMDKYPRVAKFFVQMTRQFESAKDNATLDSLPLASDPHPCGTYDYPVPDSTPKWYYYSSDDPEQDLVDAGFHRTAAYACEEGCTNDDGDWVDFTYERAYTGPYGTCSSPRFRNHGRIQSSSRYAVQYGEPNPEILSYVWPYWNWGAYCRWWHNNF